MEKKMRKRARRVKVLGLIDSRRMGGETWSLLLWEYPALCYLRYH